MVNLKTKTIDIRPDDPFKSDLLGRDKEIQNLTNFITNVNTPCVLAIDSRWGTGKTTFVKMWENYLKKQKISSIYFNAWETDYITEPLVSFLGEINRQLDDLITPNVKNTKKWEKTKQIGKKIIRHGLPSMLRIVTSGIINAEAYIEDEIKNTVGAVSGDAIDLYLNQKKSITEFHSALGAFIEDAVNGGKLIIFVDELDRCKPTYAIQLLESIKHIFNTEGIVFVLSLDKEQLCQSIKSVYGSGIDSDGYLRRFIDFEYNLRASDLDDFIDSVIDFLKVDDYINSTNLYDQQKYDGIYLRSAFKMLAKKLSMSLREIEQVLSSINIAIRLTSSDELIFSEFLTFLIIIKNTKKQIYDSYISDNENEQNMIDCFNECFPDHVKVKHIECATIEAAIIAAKKRNRNNFESKQLKKHEHILKNKTQSAAQINYSDRVIDKYMNFTNGFNPINMDSIRDRVEWIGRFNF